MSSEYYKGDKLIVGYVEGNIPVSIERTLLISIQKLIDEGKSNKEIAEELNKLIGLIVMVREFLS